MRPRTTASRSWSWPERGTSRSSTRARPPGQQSGLRCAMHWAARRRRRAHPPRLVHSSTGAGRDDDDARAGRVAAGIAPGTWGSVFTQHRHGLHHLVPVTVVQEEEPLQLRTRWRTPIRRVGRNLLIRQELKRHEALRRSTTRPPKAPPSPHRPSTRRRTAWTLSARYDTDVPRPPTRAPVHRQPDPAGARVRAGPGAGSPRPPHRDRLTSTASGHARNGRRIVTTSTDSGVR